MKQLMFIRHGSYADSESHFVSDEENGLTDIGRGEVARLIDDIRAFGPEIIIHSSMLRARQSASLINEHLSLPMLETDLLRERSFESLIGSSVDEVAFQHGKDIISLLYAFPERVEIKGSERFDDALCRAHHGLRLVLGSIKRRGVVVAHGGPHSWWLAKWFRLLPSELRRFSLDKGHYSVFEFDAEDRFHRILVLNSSGSAKHRSRSPSI